MNTYLQDFLELIPKKDILFIIGDWNAKVGSQDIPEVTGKFGLGVHSEAGQMLIEFCQEKALFLTNLVLCRSSLPGLYVAYMVSSVCV